MANQILLGRALDANGYIAPAAKATIYADGTSTLITVYSDVAGTVVAANPIVADGDGFWPQRYVTEDAKAAVTTSADVALYTLDPAPTSQGTGASASQVSFAPTVPLPQTNVQAAIEAAAALAVSGFAAFGLGITGNATLLANLDATGTGAGIYRFDGTTTGTFPTGVAAGDTGMVELWRQAGATAMMELHHATSNLVFRRRLTATVWGAWRETPNVNQATASGDLIYRGASDFVRLPKGTDGQFLTLAAGVPAWGSPNWTFLSAVTTTSGTTADTTGIPSTAREVLIVLRGVSLSGTDDLLVRLGTASGFEATGYDSDGSYGGVTVLGTTGFVARLSGSSRSHRGFMNLVLTGSNQWCEAHSTGYSNGGGFKTLADTLTQIRLLPNGTDTFDGGSYQVGYR